MLTVECSGKDFATYETSLYMQLVVSNKKPQESQVPRLSRQRTLVDLSSPEFQASLSRHRLTIF